MNSIDKLTRYIKLLQKYNRLETEYQVLREYVKEECFEKIIDKLGEPLTIKRLREENKRLRIKVKELKAELKNKK
ncbi:MAG: hypothetical protein E7168_05530 [Firmicutes bacterium]|nr:hypothetical protein [Bacillota bacterium]